MEPDQTAMVIVHMQDGFAREDPAMHELAERIATWVHDHRGELDLLVTPCFRNRVGSSYHRLVGDDMFDDADVALLPAIEALDADVRDEAHTYSAATPRILELLREQGVRRVVVAGVDTDQCVLATVFALFDAGFEPVILQDLCHATSGRTPHDAGLVALRRAVGEERVIASGQFAAQFAAQPQE